MSNPDQTQGQQPGTAQTDTTTHEQTTSVETPSGTTEVADTTTHETSVEVGNAASDAATGAGDAA